MRKGGGTCSNRDEIFVKKALKILYFAFNCEKKEYVKHDYIQLPHSVYFQHLLYYGTDAAPKALKGLSDCTTINMDEIHKALRKIN
ncbi:hypothetical protein [Halalkalibaculum sp. DA384]|uniref:hypothetical protein n=1 Tax=Halalkalibaculum sp. DA384 TaxID=3373606 RepID=UPI003754A0C5